MGAEEKWCLPLSLSLAFSSSVRQTTKNSHECFSRENAPSLKCVRTQESEKTQARGKLVREEKHQRIEGITLNAFRVFFSIINSNFIKIF